MSKGVGVIQALESACRGNAGECTVQHREAQQEWPRALNGGQSRSGGRILPGNVRSRDRLLYLMRKIRILAGRQRLSTGTSAALMVIMAVLSASA